MNPASHPPPQRPPWRAGVLWALPGLVLAGVATQSTGILAWLCWAGFALTVGVMIGLGLCDTWAPWSDVDEPGREPRPRP